MSQTPIQRYKFLQRFENQLRTRKFRRDCDIPACVLPREVCDQIMELLCEFKPLPDNTAPTRQEILNILMNVNIGSFGVYGPYAEPKADAIMAVLERQP